MKNKPLLLVLIMALLMSSCSLMKNSKSVNFARVKYNRHLKLNKTQTRELPKTIESFADNSSNNELNAEEVEESTELYAKLNEKQKEKISNDLALSKDVKLESSLEVAQVLQKVKNIEVKPKEKKRFRAQLKTATMDEWWNDDIEDWPWLEIVLAVIAVLVIAILVTWLIGLIGGIISSLIGLILLIALAYLLYVLWIQ